MGSEGSEGSEEEESGWRTSAWDGGAEAWEVGSGATVSRHRSQRRARALLCSARSVARTSSTLRLE